MKRNVALLLVIGIVLSVFLISTAEKAGDAAIEEIRADLTQSASLGGSAVGITALENGVIRVSANPGWFPNDGKTVSDVTWPDAVLSLKDSEGEYLKISAGYRYIINVVYSVTKPNQTPQVAIVYNDQNNGTQLNGAHTLAVSAKHSTADTYVLSAQATVTADRPLRLAFGGGGVYAIESVSIQRVAVSASVSVVNLTDGNLTTKEFATNILKNPKFPAWKGNNIQAVFGGWFADAAFTTPTQTVTDGATYYAKWRSVTREIDLENLNKLNGYIAGAPDQANASDTSIVPAYENGLLKVDVNMPIGGNFWAGETSLNETKQQLTLEYYDYDTDAKDNVYDGYLVMDPAKRYAINVKYTVTSVSGELHMAVVKGQKYISWDANTAIVIPKNITSTGSGTMYAQFKSGELIDNTYGINNGNTRLRLAFEGNASIVIESVTVQEIYKDDVENGNAVAGIVMDGSTQTLASWVKNLDGKWEIPKPAINGNVVEAEFDDWYTNPEFTVKVAAPNASDKKTVYYPKWGRVKRYVDLRNTNKMANANDDYFTYSAATDTEPLRVTVHKPIDGDVKLGGTGHDSSHQELTLEYYDYDPALQDSAFGGYVTVKDGRQYYLTVKYKVTSVTDKLQLSVVASEKALSWESSMPIVALDEVTATGSYTFESGAIYVGNYNVSANDRLRLAFEGYGSLEIESVLIEEVSLGEDYAFINYRDGADSFTEYVKIGNPLSNPKNMTGFGGWYRSADLIGVATVATENGTVYAKRAVAPYTFQLDFDKQSTKEFYAQAHTKSDWATTGGKAELVAGAGVDGSDAMRLTYKKLETNFSDYATNPLIWLHDTNITTGDKVAKRFNGVAGTRYLITLKYKVERTDNKSMEIYVGTRQKSQSANAALHDFGTGAWQIGDTSKIGDTITSVTGDWVSVKGYVTARDGWFPVILLKTNNQNARAEVEGENPLASILIDDICVTEVIPIIDDTVLGVMDYEDYDATVYESAKSDGILGNAYGITVTTEANHTASGKKSLKLTLQSDSLQYSGNTVISSEKEPITTTKGAAYKVTFWAMSKTDMQDVIWGVNTVAGEYASITSKHQIEVRDKVDFKANQWQKIVAYIPKLQSIPDAIGMLSVAMAANGYDGRIVYLDDIEVEQMIDSQAITFADSHMAGNFDKFVQRAFAGQKITYLPSVSKTGYLFDGWYDTPACDGKEYKVDDVFPVGKEEITLYAKWISTENIPVTDFTAGSFDPDIYSGGVKPYENVCDTAETPVYGIVNTASTQSCAWVKDAGMYGNGSAEVDGALVLQNDIYSKFVDTYGRNAIALVNADGTRFMVVKGQKYSIKFDYINGSNQGTSVIQTYISPESGYGTFGNNKGQALKHVAVHGTDTDYNTYEESFVADYTGFVYLTFTARSDFGNPHTMRYHKVYIDNVEVKADDSVKKINFMVGSKVFKTVYGRTGDPFPVFDAVEGDERTEEFEGFYDDPGFENRITTYKFTHNDVQNVYIQYKAVTYDTPSDFTGPIGLGFEEKTLDDYYRQGKHMTYWQRGELNPEWQWITNDSAHAYAGSSYIRLNGYATYWNEAKFVLYDPANPSGTMLLEKGATYRVKIMTRCEDAYDIPNLTVTLEDPRTRYLLAANDHIALTDDQKEYKNGYLCFTADITVPDTIAYLPALAIRKNVNDLQTLYIDSVSVEKIIDLKVAFEENGGTEIDGFTIQIHEKIGDPGMPFREGYDFKGWYYDKELTKLWDFDTMTVETDTVLYAKWAPAVFETLPEEEVFQPIEEEILPQEEAEEEEIVSRVPRLLAGDDHTYPAAKKKVKEETDLLPFILLGIGGVVLLAGTGVLLWLFVLRKRKKKQVRS